MSKTTEADTVRCKTCLDSHFVTDDSDRTAKPVIEAHDGTRAGWVGLLERTSFTACPDCTDRPISTVTGKPKRSYHRRSKG